MYQSPFCVCSFLYYFFFSLSVINTVLCNPKFHYHGCTGCYLCTNLLSCKFLLLNNYYLFLCIDLVNVQLLVILFDRETSRGVFFSMASDGSLNLPVQICARIKNDVFCSLPIFCLLLQRKFVDIVRYWCLTVVSCVFAV